MKLLTLLAPEIILIAVACVLLFLGTTARASARRLSALIALVTLASIFAWQLARFIDAPNAGVVMDEWNAVAIGGFATFVKAMVAGVGMLLVLLAWPTNDAATGSASYDAGHDVPEFFALGLLSLAGVMLVGGANDIILLFLGIELAAIPTYIMISISRPLPVAQESGVKYFFLGAMAAAVMLFGFSYLYGATGHIKLDQIGGVIDTLRDPATNVPAAGAWLLLGVVMLLAGLAFKIAAVPFHAYAGDVYQGAATPMTALLAFVPKTSGFLAIVKILSAVGGAHWAVPDLVVNVLWAIAVLTMTVGNVLGLLQLNVKRVFAYSSIAHSGYMLVAVTALVAANSTLQADPIHAAKVQSMALQGVLFYLLSYGVMNTGAFGLLMLLPTRATQGYDPAAGNGKPPVSTTAETFEDLAGQGRAHPWIGLGMAICCFSLIGLPLTVGFFGKIYLIAPAFEAKLHGLVVLTMLNAAISAAYYLKIIATMFIRPSPAEAMGDEAADEPLPASGFALSTGVAIAVVATFALGVVLPATNWVTSRLGVAGKTVLAPPLPQPGGKAVANPQPATQPAAVPPPPQAAAR